jgi:hypothetical protein
MKPILWLALVAALAATAYVSTQEGDEVEAVTRGSAADAPELSTRNGRRTAPASRQAPSAEADLQGRSKAHLVQSVSRWQARLQPSTPVRAWSTAWSSQQPPPPPPEPVLAPPPPRAPAFPHVWVGRYIDDQPRAIINGPTTTWVVKAGDVIEGQWRVDRIQDRQLQLTYLPLQQTLTVAMK